MINQTSRNSFHFGRKLQELQLVFSTNKEQHNSIETFALRHKDADSRLLKISSLLGVSFAADVDILHRIKVLEERILAIEKDYPAFAAYQFDYGQGSLVNIHIQKDGEMIKETIKYSIQDQISTLQNKLRS